MKVHEATPTKRRMIFHAPREFDGNGSGAENLRPAKMLAAFENLGYEVHVATGSSVTRSARIKEVSDLVRAGVTFEFLYSESAVLPNALADNDRRPKRPLMDARFLGLCRKAGIPTAVFYRDIYWRFLGDRSWKERAKQLLATPLYILDLALYRHVVNVLFVPSDQMKERVPFFPKSRMRALPPGADVPQDEVESTAHMSLLYVGGVGGHYGISTMFEAVSRVDGVRLTVCTRRQEWKAVKKSYPQVDGTKIRVLHLSESELSRVYEEADITSLMVEPTEYRSIAVPYKLYEYMAHGKPTMASTGTLASERVEALGVGWAVGYDVDAIVEFLAYLRDTPSVIETATSRVRQERSRQTWANRAKDVVRELTSQR
ncbi:glycosyltransferase [Schaalia sp. JY-X169]|uniref:glycosyltransferase n=1 Tax=Schaalia sp. JY-X169 TaxID=2758572 RepID=UPI0015F3C64C|nr:glycosyltransferase [Schaalia sp. JY-X169]